ncbi:DUF418 domain-containing protein [Gephyromycinifex aptenodytis]|uniref:DUF418 domain-containing protein n=1 Tax=Gephyromycinifex aptenodytis TaxID=2716227 RepID=UPI001447FAD9|nr:DUF418 domain-containing protein [Gephyromycinifex aptenodytis]
MDSSLSGDRAIPSRLRTPDLARGMMLLLIAWANIPAFLWRTAPDPFTGHPAPQSRWDVIVQFATITAIDMRVYPMFAFLLGYGMVQFVQARLCRGLPLPEAMRRLRLRHLCLMLFGLAHAALLFTGDVLATYGLCALILVALLFRHSDRVVIGCVALLVTGLLGLTVFAVGTDSFVQAAQAETAGAGGTPSPMSLLPAGVSESSYLASIGPRLLFWLFATVISALFFVIPGSVLLGWLAARHRILERPHAHLRLLWATAVFGGGLGVLGALPMAAHLAGFILLPETLKSGYGMVQMSTGLFGGLGYVAIFALLGHYVVGPDSRLGWAVQALGRRSLSGYLAQSVILAPLMSAWGLGLGRDLSSAPAAVIAFLTWLSTLAGAAALEARGRRGPAEYLLRRLVDGPAATPVRVVAQP